MTALGEAERQVHLLEYWRVLADRRWVVYSTVLLVTGMVMLGSFLVAPRYEAVARLQVESSAPRVLPFQSIFNEGESGDQFLATESRLVRSGAVLAEVVRRQGLEEHPLFAPAARRDDEGLSLEQREHLLVEELGEHVDVDLIRNTRLIEVSVETADAALSARLANGIVEEYIRFNARARYNTTEEASRSVSRQIELLRREIEEKQKRLQEYARQHGIVPLDETQDIISRELEELTLAASEARKKRIVAEAHYVAMRESPIEVLPELMSNEIILTLGAKHAELERQHASMSQRFKPDWPAMARVRKELANVRQRLEAERADLYARLLGDAREAYVAALKEERALDNALEAQKGRAQEIGLRMIEYDDLKADIKNRQETLESMVRREAETSASASMSEDPVTNIRVVDGAQVPLEPSWPRKGMNLLLSLVAGLGLGVGLAFFFDYLDDSLKSPEDVSEVSRLPCLGRIPNLPEEGPVLSLVGDRDGRRAVKGADVDFAVQRHPESQAAESFREVRTGLLISSPGGAPKTVLVTSPEPQEGKTTVALNLAMVLTQARKRVLLVDSDLRRPRVHTAFGLPAERGLSNVLGGEEALERVILRTEIEDLFVLASGPRPPNPAELLDSDEFRALVARLAADARFDHVIFDSPPALVATDSLIMGQVVDAVLMVVRAGETSRSGLAQSVEKLRRARARLLGAVLNGGDPSHLAGYYSAYYRSTEDVREDRRTVAAQRSATERSS